MVAFAAALFLFAAVQLDESEVDTVPEFLPPVVEVQTEALGLSASEVEQLITVPLEANLLNGVAWLDTIESESMPGLSSIVMTFEPGTDLFQARQVVQERLTQAKGLPNVSRAPAMVQPVSSEGRVMMVGLSSDTVSLIDMSVLARWTIRPFLMGVNGVANVAVWGQRERQLQVLADQRDLVAADVTLLDVVRTTGNALWVSPLTYLEASTPGAGGFIDGPNQRIGIQHILGIESPEDLAAVSIEGREGITLGDVATVVEDHQALIGDAVVDEGPGLFLIVEKFPWSNTVDTTTAVEKALEELAPGLTGIQVETDLFRPAGYLERSIDNVQRTAIMSLILVILAMFALLSRWRVAAVSALSMILSLATAGVVLFITRTEINSMVLAGLVLAIGFIVFDSVDDAERVQSRLWSRGADTADATIGDSLAKSRWLSFSTFVIVAVALVPVFVMDGAAGEFLPDIGLTMLAALLLSIIVSITVTPVLGALLLADDSEHRESWLVTKLGRGFRRTHTSERGSGLRAAVATAVLAVVAVALLPTIERSYVPEFRQTDLLIRFDGVAGTSLQASKRVVASAASEIGALSGVEDVGAHVGRAVLSDEVVNVNSSELWVKIDPDANYSNTIDAIQEIVDGYPGHGTPQAVSYSNARVDDVLRRPADDVVVRLYGENPAVLDSLAEELVALVDEVDGTGNVRALHSRREPAVEIEVDLEKAAAFGLKPGDIRRTAATLLSGIQVGSLFEQQKVFDVVVWSPPEHRQNVSSVETLLIGTPDRDVVQLSEVADVRIAPVENVIRREAVSRYIDVVADVSGRSAESVRNDITAAIEARGLPFEYHARILDDQSESASNQNRVFALTIAVALTILLVLQAAFGSWRLALLLFATSLLALSGGVVALAVSGGVYSIGSSIGLFALFGLAVRSELSLVAHLNSLQLDDGMSPGPVLMTRGLAERFASTVTPLITTALAMVPIIVFGESAGLEVIRPLAIVVFGGLISIALVTLLIVPAAYARFAKPAVRQESLV